jgi:hypothetical protein
MEINACNRIESPQPKTIIPAGRATHWTISFTRCREYIAERKKKILCGEEKFEWAAAFKINIPRKRDMIAIGPYE